MSGSYIATYATVTMSVGAQRNWLAAGGFDGEFFQPAPVYAVSKANYATGQVTQGVRNVSSWVGGFTGYCAEARRSRYINMVLSYWDTQTIGQTESGCEYGYNAPSHNMLESKTTVQLLTPTNENAYDAGSIYEHWGVTIRGRTIDPWDFGTSQDYPSLDYCSDPSKQYCPLREYHALPKVSISSREQDGQITEGEAAVFTVTLEETLTSDLDVYVWFSEEG